MNKKPAFLSQKGKNEFLYILQSEVSLQSQNIEYQSRKTFESHDIRICICRNRFLTTEIMRKRGREVERTYRTGLSPTNCDFSVWNGVPNVITAQVGNLGCCRFLGFLPVFCRFSLPAEFWRPPKSSASQLIARCFIASLTVRIIAGIFLRSVLPFTCLSAVTPRRIRRLNCMTLGTL